jgi:hypothetical protein
MMDSKGKQIAYQVAFKAAIDLIAAGKVIVPAGAEVGPGIFTLTDELFATLDGKLEGFEGGAAPAGATVTPFPQPAPPAPSAPAPVATTNLAPCPDCAQHGRNGILLHNEKGPEWTCSLRESKKIGGKWTEVGTCTFVDWGANGKKF